MMKKILAFSFLLLQILFGQTSNGLFITEVMFNPLEPNGEFVELFNSSDSTIVLSGFFVKYSTNKADKIIPVNNKAILPPQHYAVIFENDYNFANGVYMEKISDTTLVLQIDNGKFGSYGMANSTDREILLLSEKGDTVDTYTYSANNKRGYSDEKICPDCSNNSENWSNSKILHGTPGGINSVSPRNYDLFASSLKVYPKEIFVEDKMEVSFKIINSGKKNVDNYRIRIFLDINQDSLVQEREILLDTLLTFIKSGDSLNVFGSKIINRSGSFILFAEVIFSEDELPGNNNISRKIFVRKKKNKPNDIIINEIMYQPEGNEPEWVELFNRTDEKINLKNWRFADKTSKPVIADSTFFIDSKSYLILTDDPELLSYHKILSPVKIFNLPSLNNKTDNLKLYDSLGQVIDSLAYNSSWGGGNGYSLERVSTEESGNDSTNWKTSCSKYLSTPGKINSVTLKNKDLEISEIKLLQPYAVTEIPFQIEFTVFNRGREDVANFSVEIYRDVNLDGITQTEELQLNINVNGLSAGDSVHYTETLSNFGKGQNEYIFTVVFPDDEFTENNQSGISFTGVEINEVRNDLVINEIMYAPNKPEPEWIEIYNRSNKKIDLKNYQIADASDTLKVMESETVLLPDNYFVFADDSSFIDVYPDCKNFIVAKLPNLNNSGDKIILLDSLNRTIDSLLYSAKWGGTKGVSLERISSEILSTDSLNWKSALVDSGGTPAKVNSISQKEFDVAVKQILFLPVMPHQKEDVSVFAKIKNEGKKKISFYLQLFEENFKELKLMETTGALTLFPEDSITYKFNYVIESINCEHNILIKAVSENEQDTSNNQLTESIMPRFIPLSLAVNEIMYSPVNGEPEWVELLNISDDSINVKGITISDVFTTPKETRVNTNLFINSGEYLIITKDSNITDYHSSIKNNMIILSFANLNNDVDGIVIRDFYGETIDSVMYRRSWGGMNGHSLERVLTTNPSGDSSNWKNSVDLELSTPGKKNSVTPFNNDLQIAEISSIPEFPRLGEEIGIKTKIKNIGLQKALIYTVVVRVIAKNGTKVLGKTELHNLASNDSIIYITKEKSLLEDSVTVEAEINYEKDNNTTNNNTKITIYPGAKRKTFLITEFMANPNKGNAEWIELYNTSSKSIDISNWLVGDLFPTPAQSKIAEKHAVIEPSKFVVLTNDTSKFINENINVFQVKFGTLGNNEDGIVLYDFNGNVIDSLKYDYHDWQIRKGRSLERVSFSVSSSDAENWLPSLALTGGTPGKENSVSYTTPAANNSVLINEIMFDPDVNNSEFVEFYNYSDTPIDIGGWKLIVNNNKFFEVSPTFYTLEKNEYFVLASDSAILNNYYFPNRSKIRITDKKFSLPNSSGTLVITDHWGNRIDSLVYNSDWHNQNIAVTKNKSLERISLNVPSNEEGNWSTSVNNNGATPCSVNSVFAENKLVATGITFSPNPFSPDNDGFEDFSVINYSLPFVTAQIRIKIFDDHGRLVRTLINNQAVASKGSVVFNGLDDSGNVLRIGMYIVFMEAVDEHSGKSVCYKDVIVIARKL